jgi:hypothetical protein
MGGRLRLYFELAFERRVNEGEALLDAEVGELRDVLLFVAYVGEVV